MAEDILKEQVMIDDIMSDYDPEVESEDLVIEEPVADIWADKEKRNEKKMEELTKKKFEINNPEKKQKLISERSSYRDRTKDDKSESAGRGFSWGGSSSEEKKKSTVWGGGSSYYGSSSSTSRTIEDVTDDGFSKIRKSAIEAVENEENNSIVAMNPQLNMMLGRRGGANGKMRRWFGPRTPGRKAAITTGIITLKGITNVILTFRKNGGWK